MYSLKKLTWIIFFLFWIINCQNAGCSDSCTTDTQPSLREPGTGSPGGIPNLGATCYMNSVLQILKAFYLPKINEKNDELAKALQSLAQVIQDDKNVANRAEATSVFKALHNKFGWQPNPNNQEDVEELIKPIFNWMELPLAETCYTITKLTTLEIRSTPASPWLTYPVELGTEENRSDSMQVLFNNSLKQERIKDYEWEPGGARVEVDKAPLLENLDNLYKGILVLQLKRFITEGGDTRSDDGALIKKKFEKIKITKKIQDPFCLKIEKEKTVEMDRDRYYNLTGFILHTGKESDSGHYLAYIKKDDTWILYNDDKNVSPVSDIEAEARAKESYLFFYQPSQSRRVP
ncbi:MAG: hypothetical protein ACYC2U_03375 [Candidatus Amoebophilus sp.]